MMKNDEKRVGFNRFFRGENIGVFFLCALLMGFVLYMNSAVGVGEFENLDVLGVCSRGRRAGKCRLN